MNVATKKLFTVAAVSAVSLLAILVMVGTIDLTEAVGLFIVSSLVTWGLFYCLESRV